MIFQNNLNSNVRKFSTVFRRLDKNSGDINKELKVDIYKDLDILSEKVNKLVSLQEEIKPFHKKFFEIRKDVLESADTFLVFRILFPPRYDATVSR